jgi:hypothetical protein
MTRRRSGSNLTRVLASHMHANTRGEPFFAGRMVDWSDVTLAESVGVLVRSFADANATRELHRHRTRVCRAVPIITETVA